MGNNKTERIIQDLTTEERPVIYITPLLSEVTRVSGAILNDKGVHLKDDHGYYMYDKKHPLANKRFYLPSARNKEGSKLHSIKHLISAKHNICSTHKLFSMFDLEIIEILKENKYILVVDEALEVWSNFKLNEDADDSDDSEDKKGYTKTDKNIQTMIKNGFIEVDPLGLLWWQDEKFHDAENTLYANVKKYCDLKQLYISNGRVVFWGVDLWWLFVVFFFKQKTAYEIGR